MNALIAHEFASSILLLLMLLNPFLLVIYLIDLIQELSNRDFLRVMVRAGAISCGVFIIVALAGDAIFTQVLQVKFASFQIFGGIIFLLIGIQFMFTGPEAIRNMRGKPEHVAGAIAMPIMIGPSTVSASILVGGRLPPTLAAAAVVVAVFVTVGILILLKHLHDAARPRNAKLIERYLEIMGRVTALVIGTYSIEMIMQGLRTWAVHLGS
ncbi:MAG: MarC family protein [Desulfuromonadaceae bacterium]|nr:MarC family protein [Desulfuromonadaceae bacterium]MDD2856234.1 MarC family protein [Desulfuromonadaceae bacterium]